MISRRLFVLAALGSVCGASLARGQSWEQRMREDQEFVDRLLEEGDRDLRSEWKERDAEARAAAERDAEQRAEEDRSWQEMDRDEREMEEMDEEDEEDEEDRRNREMER